MEKYNAQLRDSDKYSGKVIYVPAAGRNAYVRVDWQRPLGEILSVADGQYTLYKTRIKTAYVGSAASRQKKMGGALDFLSMSRQQLVSRFEPLQDIYDETLWGGERTTHVKLVPKGAASYKYAEVWVTATVCPCRPRSSRRTTTDHRALDEHGTQREHLARRVSSSARLGREEDQELENSRLLPVKFWMKRKGSGVKYRSPSLFILKQFDRRGLAFERARLAYPARRPLSNDM